MTFFIDTNMLFKPARLADLKRICGEVGHEVVTSSLVLAERLHQIARKGRDVDAANAGIEGLVHSIISFDEAEAVAVAQALAEALRARQAEVPEEQRDEL
ncbi:hypothetical protein L6R46_24945, partial [Myxococcota bacterium]|nr:hypothetical protein [Myxococcota bacterium]